MSRVLITSLAAKGEINPRAGVATHLIAAGAEVAWLCTLGVPDGQIASLGVRLCRMPQENALVSGEARSRAAMDPAANEQLMSMMIEKVPSPERIAAIGRVIEEFRPDVIALDGACYDSVIAAHLAGVRYVGLSANLMMIQPPDLDCEMTRSLHALAPKRAQLFNRYGMNPELRAWECTSPWLNTVFADESFVGDNIALPRNTFLVGPSILQSRGADETAFPWHRLRDDRPIVLVSFGSRIYFLPQLFAIIAEAAAVLGVQLVIAAGELAQTDFAQGLPGDVLMVSYAPQLAMLERASVLINHGGANSVSEALYWGVPQLVVPICNDAPIQAHFVEQSRAGIQIEKNLLSPATCREALRTLLAPANEYRLSTQRISESYRARNGAAEAANRILLLSSQVA